MIEWLEYMIEYREAAIEEMGAPQLWICEYIIPMETQPCTPDLDW